MQKVIQTPERIDLIDLSEEIAEKKRHYSALKRSMSKQQRRAMRKDVNKLVKQYNDIVGKHILEII